MPTERYQYFAVLQTPNKPVFRETVIYINERGGIDPKTGQTILPVCRGIEPNGAGLYTIDTQAEYAREKIRCLRNEAEKPKSPIIGPFGSVEEAVKAERKRRPLTVEEKLAQLDAKDREIAELKQQIAGKEADGDTKKSR